MKLAVVAWVDSLGGNQWHALSDLEPEKLKVIYSVGWVLKKTKESIHLLSSLCPELEKAGQDMIIPAGCIKKVTYVGTKYTIR